MQHFSRFTHHVSRFTRHIPRFTLWWLILWAAWAVRLGQLDASDLTFDEAATYFVANRPVLDILTYLRGAVREHPPVYYLLIHPWMSLAGSSEYSLRFFAVGASMLGITLTARLARRIARRLGVTGAAGLTLYASLPALILALFPCEVYYARDARMYTLMIVWATLSSLQFLPFLFDQAWPRRSTLVSLLLVNGLGLFTHYYLALLIAAQFVSLFLLRRWRAWLAWSITHGLVGLLGVIWLMRSPGLSASLTETWGRFAPAWPTTGQLRRLLANLLFSPIEGVPWTLVYAWGLLVALGLFVAWLRPFRRSARPGAETKPKEQQVVGVWLTVTCLLPVALAFLIPEPRNARYLIFVLPFAALAVGQLLTLGGFRLRKSAGIWLILSALTIAVLGVYGLPRTVKWIKSNYGRTVATISAHARPGDGVLFYGPWQSLMFHYYKPEDFPPITRLPLRAPPLLSPEQAEPVLKKLMVDYQRLWVIPAAVDDVDPPHFVAGWLNTYAHPTWITHDFSLYLPPLQQEAFSKPIDLIFGDRLRLERLASDAQTVPAGESLRLALTWEAVEPLENDVVLVLRLVDARDYGWRQWEIVPGRWLNPPSTWGADVTVTDRHGLIVPQGAPPGPFTLRLTVVDAASDAPLQPSDATGPLAQAGVDLMTFDVVEPVAPPVLAEIEDFMGPFTFESPAGSLSLAAYGLGGLRFQQGYPVPLRLHWLTPTEPLPEVEMRLQLWHQPRWSLFGGQATPIATQTLSLIPDYPVGDWSAGRLVSLPTALPIPADAASGRANLTLALLSPDGQTWTVDGEQRLNLGTLTIEERPILKKLPSGLTAIQIDFGDQIGLRGYRIEGEAKPGGQLILHYAWYALRVPDRQYSVFNHLLTADGQFITQADGWPQDPNRDDKTAIVLTKQWRPGEYVPDQHILAIPPDAPPGPYLLAVGLYGAVNGERLPAVYEGQPLPNDQWLYQVDGRQ